MQPEISRAPYARRMRADASKVEQLLTIAAERARGVRVHLAATMASALQEDALLRARLFNELLATVEQVARELQSARLDAISDLREQGYSYDDLARVLGVSKGRAQQLVAAVRRRGNTSPS